MVASFRLSSLSGCRCFLPGVFQYFKEMLTTGLQLDDRIAFLRLGITANHRVFRLTVSGEFFTGQAFYGIGLISGQVAFWHQYVLRISGAIWIKALILPFKAAQVRCFSDVKPLIP